MIFDLEVGPRVSGLFMLFLYSVYINAFVRYGENKALDPFLEKRHNVNVFVFKKDPNLKVVV